jgi:hypothetical protein
LGYHDKLPLAWLAAKGVVNLYKHFEMQQTKRQMRGGTPLSPESAVLRHGPEISLNYTNLSTRISCALESCQSAPTSIDTLKVLA